ncbi:hypothetical protein ACCAA_80011 [Candidatus Accumulibacter aalborgensis]|uniref:Sialate O-acetylesterase domain-containing protein n=1 Tax=Candidatus Accumulibacter aalborgensis TaxID=1860102 RepID=A0A1A8Y0P3_9PROT|nr:hypothetical protein ACCAA_80011 [Candidatus Accumulibacter aalborgensis]
MIGRGSKWLVTTLVIASASVALLILQKHLRPVSGLAARLGQIARMGSETGISCADVVSGRPLVLLALGQSNAANHGSLDRRDVEAVTLVAEGKCSQAVDPLAGGTGDGGSIWQRLPAALREQRSERPIVISVLGVDASSIDEWTRPDSPLRQRLVEQIASLLGLGLLPDFVLWQQGEADSRAGTSSDDYAERLDRLAALLHEAGAKAPIILALSTICRSAPNDAIRRAITAKASADRRFRLGPDTDVLAGEGFRRDGCHFTSDGLISAAKMWAVSINAEVSRSMPPVRQAPTSDRVAANAAQSASVTRAGPDPDASLRH